MNGAYPRTYADKCRVDLDGDRDCRACDRGDQSHLIFLFGGVAALLAGTLAALGVPPIGQILGFAVAALLIPALLRPRLLRRLGGVGVLSRTDALIGQMARVTKAIDPVAGAGRVLVQGHDWAANSTEPILEGALVEVLGSDGIVLLVAPVAELSSGGNN